MLAGIYFYQIPGHLSCAVFCRRRNGGKDKDKDKSEDIGEAASSRRYLQTFPDHFLLDQANLVTPTWISSLEPMQVSASAMSAPGIALSAQVTLFCASKDQQFCHGSFTY